MDVQLTGSWHNQHGSVLHVIEDGLTITGTFRPGVGPLKGETFGLQGVRLGDQIAFNVPFAMSASITSWIGHVRHDAAGDLVETLWQMVVREDRSEAGGGWRGIWTGSDTFRRGEPGLVLVDSRLPSVPIRT